MTQVPIFGVSSPQVLPLPEPFSAPKGPKNTARRRTGAHGPQPFFPHVNGTTTAR